MEREPRADKAAVVDEVRERFEAADAVLVTEYRGLDVGQMADLRRALRDAGTTYKIFKNTLVRRAVLEGAPDGFDELLVGPTGLAFVESDPSGAAKALKEFASAHDQLVIKGGVLSGSLLDPSQVRELAELPSRDEVLAQLAGGFAAPLQQLVSMMNNLMSEMAGLIQALSDKGGADTSPTSAEEPAAQEPEPAPPADEPVAVDGDDQPAEEEAAADQPASED